MKGKAISTWGLSMVLVAAMAGAQAPSDRPQIFAGKSVTLAAEVVALDATTRRVTLKGPFGGLVSGEVSAEVGDLAKYKLGDLVTASYYEAVAASMQRKGDKPLVVAADAAAKAEPGKSLRSSKSVSATATVFSVDVPGNALVLQGADKTLYAIDVARPEFQAKLKDLQAGDSIDIVYSEALVTGLTPLAAGQEAKWTMKSGTLVVDRAEVVKSRQNVLMLRNERGRMLKVSVPGDFIFTINGQQVSVYDIKEGTILARTAIRVTEASYSD